jgi:hypothetical protein
MPGIGVADLQVQIMAAEHGGHRDHRAGGVLHGVGDQL